jgi:hypothetical protein
MPKLEFPVLSEGLLVDVLIGLDGATTTALVAAGQPVAAPIRARGEIDTGCNVTAVSAALLRRLGVYSSSRIGPKALCTNEHRLHGERFRRGNIRLRSRPPCTTRTT